MNQRRLNLVTCLYSTLAISIGSSASTHIQRKDAVIQFGNNGETLSGVVFARPPACLPACLPIKRPNSNSGKEITK
ncbi:hypothetical protein B0H16DRAFT_1568568 [Mycena metata]|uniref:Uncharacterized protein n=1 Tax=Mycena metata TaxID=1033252 RepID=A0AAD7IBV7_9AGAR|nr:hypothetical protein B0H16DRAFT_1568568 [Mycena metata]